MPDIDTDFEDSERERVIDYCKAKYGTENVSRIGTIGVLAAKGIIRSIQRIEGKEVALANKICKTIPNTPGITLAGALESSPEFKKMYDEEDEVKEMVDTAMKLEGLAKTTGIHACFDEDTLVQTKNGLKRIIDVKVGDLVLTHNNKFEKVCDTIKTHTNKVYKFKIANSLGFEVTGNHPFLVKVGKTAKAKWITASSIRPNDYMAIAINQEAIIPSGNLPFDSLDFWWIIGRYLGDGWYETPKNRNDKRIIICCNKNNSETQNITSKLDNLNMHYFVSEFKTVNKIYISNKDGLFDYLLGFGKYAHLKHLNSDVLNLPKELLNSFMDGYLSADGSYMAIKNSYSFKTVSKQLAIGLMQVVNKLYKKHCSVTIIPAKQEIIEGRIIQSKEKYSCVFTKNTRKKEQAFYDTKYIWTKVRNIDIKDIEKDMYNLTVENDSSYTANGIVAHNCGILIAPDAVNNFIPQQILKNPKNGEKELTTQYTGPECEDSGLLKMDFLGLRTLGVLHEGINDINKVSENKIDLTSIPINDMETMKFLSTGMTDGVFQFESSFMKDIVKKMLQDINSNKTLTGDICFNRLTDATALGRPGPMATIPDYVKNLLNPAQIKPTNTPLDEILKPTYGIIVYQEQVMNAVKALAGFSAGDADAVRKAMGKKLMDKMAILREMFIYGNKEKGIPGCIKNGYDEKWAIELWDRMAEFAKYAFNKSHAVAYTYLSLKTAWISKYYPNIFYKSNLNSFIDNNDKIKQYINVAKKRGVNVLGPDINLSGQAFSIDYENYNNMSPIRFGLKGIKTLGDSSKYIIQERELNGPFINLQDFVTRMISNYSIGKKSIEALIKAGALDSFEGTRKNKIDALDKLVNSCKAEANELKRGQLTIFQLAKEMNNTDILNQIEELNHIDYDLNDKYSLEEELKAEKEYTGFYISRHPIDEYKTYLTNKDAVSIENIIKDKEEEEIIELVEESESSDEQLDQTTLDDILDLDSEVTIGGIIKDLEVHYSKKNNSKLKTFVIEDDTAEIKAVAFTKTLERNNIDNIINDDNVVICTGKVVKDDFGTQLIVSNISKIDDDKLSIPSTINIKIPSKIIGAKVRELINEHLDTKKSTRLVMWYSEDDKTFKSYTRYVKYSCSLIEGLTSIVGPKNIKTK